MRKAGGRPRPDPKAGERATLTLRVTPGTKAKLDQSGRTTGRNLSQEAEARIEQTFREEHDLEQALDLAYGRRVAGLSLVLARAIADAVTMATMARRMSSSRAPAADLSDPWAYDEAVDAVTEVLRALRPSGEAHKPVVPTGGLPPAMAAAMQMMVEPGRAAAGALLAALSGNAATGELGEWAAKRRRQLAERDGEGGI